MNTPVRTETRITRYEWTIGEESEPTTARDLNDGIFVAQKEMQDLGVDLGSDDCYYARAGDGGQIILYVDIENE